jgi:RNA polymerase sigma factor (sigma-70 family)
MTAAIELHTVSDAELARAAAACDRRALAIIYERYADRLNNFCVGMVRDRDIAADCVQEVFCTAAAQLPALRDPEKLRPWLYAIARNEVLRALRDRDREPLSTELPEMASTEPGPDTFAVRTELAELIADAAAGLSDRDRAALQLAYRHGLNQPQIAQALGVSSATAKKVIQRMRYNVERSLGALLIARRGCNKPERCAELSLVLEDWDGQFSILMRKRIARHIDSCLSCEQQRRRLVNPAALLGGGGELSGRQPIQRRDVAADDSRRMHVFPLRREPVRRHVSGKTPVRSAAERCAAGGVTGLRMDREVPRKGILATSGAATRPSPPATSPNPCPHHGPPSRSPASWGQGPRPPRHRLLTPRSG